MLLFGDLLQQTGVVKFEVADHFLEFLVQLQIIPDYFILLQDLLPRGLLNFLELVQLIQIIMPLLGLSVQLVLHPKIIGSQFLDLPGLLLILLEILHVEALHIIDILPQPHHNIRLQVLDLLVLPVQLLPQLLVFPQVDLEFSPGLLLYFLEVALGRVGELTAVVAAVADRCSLGGLLCDSISVEALLVG